MALPEDCTAKGFRAYGEAGSSCQWESLVPLGLCTLDAVPWPQWDLLSLNGPFPGGLELLRNFKAELREGFHFSQVPS